MGFSRGGQAALYAGLDRFNKLWNKSGVQFAGYIPFYPDCSTRYATDTEVAAALEQRPFQLEARGDGSLRSQGRPAESLREITAASIQ
jgi:hypothetical protein